MKFSTEVDKTAKPAIVVVDINAHKETVTKDPYDSRGLIYRGVIPPQQVKRIITL